jgi:hypothetical protein
MNQDLSTATLKSGIDTVIHGVARHVPFCDEAREQVTAARADKERK